MLWDMRQKAAAMTYKQHTDYISDLSLLSLEGGGAHRLLAASGDGTLSAHDLRTRKCVVRTEDDADDELLSGEPRCWGWATEAAAAAAAACHFDCRARPLTGERVPADPAQQGPSWPRIL